MIVSHDTLCWTEIPDQNIIFNLIYLVATNRLFKMLTDYTLDLTPPPPPQGKTKTEIQLFSSSH